jgi:hypothetical protein
MICYLWVLLICGNVDVSSAQSTTSNEAHCFSIRIHLNGQPLEGPKTVTFRTRQGDSTVSLDRGTCFKVPSDLLMEEKLDIFFTVPGSNIYLNAMALDFFENIWDIDLQDKKFSRDVHLPRHARAINSCNIVFHGGEPEIVMSVNGCRMPSP